MLLVSLILTLKPREAAAVAPHLGRAAHAALLRAVNAADAALAAQLHDEPGSKPFTCSSLLGKRQEKTLDPACAYTLRYTTLADELARAMLPSAWR